MYIGVRTTDPPDQMGLKSASPSIWYLVFAICYLLREGKGKGEEYSEEEEEGEKRRSEFSLEVRHPFLSFDRNPGKRDLWRFQREISISRSKKSCLLLLDRLFDSRSSVFVVCSRLH